VEIFEAEKLRNNAFGAQMGVAWGSVGRHLKKTSKKFVK